MKKIIKKSKTIFNQELNIRNYNFNTKRIRWSINMKGNMISLLKKDIVKKEKCMKILVKLNIQLNLFLY